MRDFSSQVHWLNARLHIVVAVLISLLVAVGFGVSAGEGDFRFVYVALLGAVVVAVMGMLGDKYWLLVPFSLTAQLPAIPVMRRMIELPEMMITLCTITFACRFALKRQRFTIFQSGAAPVLLYISWVAMIFIRNPVGLEAMGADTGGARFYAKLALALASYFIVVNQRITERDCKTILLLALVGSLFGSISHSVLYFYGTPTVEEVSGLNPLNTYGWQQHIATVPGMVIMLLLSRYRSSELFSFHRIGLLVLVAVCCLFVLVSGKRMAVASIPLLLISAAFIRKEYNFVFLWTAAAVTTCALILALHGTLFTLPLNAQRALSWLPGRWDASLHSMEGGKDTFREQLRELAIEKIKADPWIGKGYAVDRKIMALIAVTPNQSEKVILQMAQGSAWHNTWLGYAADFGIPASALQAVIYGHVLWLGLRLFRRLPSGSMMQTFVMYVLLYTIRDVASSHTGGHSAIGPFDRWWMYGILVSMGLRIAAAGDEPAGPQSEATTLPARSRAGGRRPALREPIFARRVHERIASNPG